MVRRHLKVVPGLGVAFVVHCKHRMFEANPLLKRQLLNEFSMSAGKYSRHRLVGNCDSYDLGQPIVLNSEERTFNAVLEDQLDGPDCDQTFPPLSLDCFKLERLCQIQGVQLLEGRPPEVNFGRRGLTAEAGKVFELALN